MNPKSKLMIVDDERDVVDLFEGMLCNEFIVITAYSGRLALKKLMVERPDLILLNILMPEMSGWEVLDKIKQSRELKNIPIIMLTAVRPDFNILEKGIDNYLIKPVGQKQLIDAIQETLNARKKIEKLGEVALSQGVKRELIEEYMEKAQLLDNNERLLSVLKQIYFQNEPSSEKNTVEYDKNMLREKEKTIRMQKVQIYRLMTEINKYVKPEELYLLMRSEKKTD